jgi:hypothetical protein
MVIKYTSSAPVLVELRQNLRTNKANYVQMIRETEAFSPESKRF